MLLDRAGTIGGKQPREVVDALQKRFADVGVRHSLSDRGRIDDLLRGVDGTR